MTRLLQSAGVVGLVALTMGALAAAPAAATQLRSEAQATILTGEIESVQVFQFPLSELKCNKATFTGTVVGNAVNEFRLAPTYSECSYNGAPVTAAVNGCEYLVTVTPVGGHSPVHILCPTGAKIEFSIPLLSCTLKIAAQTPGQGLNITNKGIGSSQAITYHATLGSVVYERVGSASCLKIGSGSDLAILAQVTVRGYKDESGVEGPQVGIWIA